MKVNSICHRIRPVRNRTDCLGGATGRSTEVMPPQTWHLPPPDGSANLTCRRGNAPTSDIASELLGLSVAGA